MEPRRSTAPAPRLAVAERPRTISWPFLRLMRPKHYVKNAFVLAPLMFSGTFVQLHSVLESVLALGFFCAASSAVYILNDLRDIEKDRQHSIKRHTRPLAAGVISPGQGKAALAILYSLLIAWGMAQPRVGVVVAVYVILNVAYTIRLKHMPPLDLFTLATGFLLRVYAGSTAIGVDISSWMFVTTLCLALYLAATKRRQELLTHGPAARAVLASYSPTLLDSYAQTSAVAALLFYGLFAATVRPALAISVPAVLFGLFRYRYITEMHGDGESPTDALWNDKTLVITGIVWAVSCLYAVWSSPATGVQRIHF